MAICFSQAAASGEHAHAVLEQREAFGEAEAVVEVLGDALLDAPLPHARLGALLRVGADQ